MVKNLPANAGDIEMQVPSLGPEDPLKEGLSNHYSLLAWRIPWTEEPVGLRPIGSQRILHDKLLSTSVQFSRSVVSNSL